MAPLASLAAVLHAVQAPPSGSPATPPATSSSAMTAKAVRADVPPLSDGRDDDAVWRIAPAITAFRQFQPVEDAEPRYRTEVKVAYDAHNFYVFIRAFDAHPDSILKLLARRDIRT